MRRSLSTNNTKTTNCFLRKKRPNTPLVCRYLRMIYLRMCGDQCEVVRRCLRTLCFIIFLVYLARSKRPNTPHFVFKRIVRNFEVRDIGPKWGRCRHTHVSLQNGPRWVTHNSVSRKNTNSYVCTYFQLNFVLICDHLDLNCYYFVKNGNCSDSNITA